MKICQNRSGQIALLKLYEDKEAGAYRTDTI